MACAAESKASRKARPTRPARALSFIARVPCKLDIGIAWTQSTAPDVYRKWQDGFFDALRGYSNGEAYQNFIGPTLTDWALTYYVTTSAAQRR